MAHEHPLITPVPDTTMSEKIDPKFTHALEKEDWRFVNETITKTEDLAVKGQLFRKAVEVASHNHWHNIRLAIGYTKDPELQLAYLKKAVDHEVANKMRFTALRLIRDFSKKGINHPEYDDRFVEKLYNDCVAEGRHEEAHQIAKSMLQEHEEQVESNPDHEEAAELYGVWIVRERSALKSFATQALKAPPDRKLTHWILRGLFDQMRQRGRDENGLLSKKRSALATQVAERAIMNTFNGLMDGEGYQLYPNPHGALRDAIETRMSPEFIEKIRLQVSPTIREQVQKFFNDLALDRWWERKS